MEFSTKAETLQSLRGIVRSATVLPQVCFTVRQWRDAQGAIEGLSDLPDFLTKQVIVRSSAVAEDANNESLAGHFRSIKGVLGLSDVTRAVNDVIASFDGKNDDDQVFIQPMIENAKVSGVVFTRDPSNGGHYWVVNYDDQSGETDTVTDGSSNDLKTLYCFKTDRPSVHGWLADLCHLCQELETRFARDALDIEFAVDRDGNLILLQVRPLILKDPDAIERSAAAGELANIKRRVRELSKPHPYLYGDKTVFGVMPDWNPAEIVGVRPRPLALSMYKELVTDNIWAYQRDNYGYRNLRSFPLLVSFSGLPYIDVRVSFNSFIPSGVPEELARKLANHYIDQLCENPNHHDKVEFEIIYSCYTLDLPQRLGKLRANGFNEKDCEVFRESLRELTKNIIDGRDGLWKRDRERLSQLEDRYNIVTQSSLTPLEKIYWLIEDCKRYGTLPFAGLARAGFIAVQLLKSMVTVGILTERDYELFMNSLATVSSTMSQDFLDMSRKKFLRKYGHLRPGTYDILSPRYDEDPERYFDWEQEQQTLRNGDGTSFSLKLETLNQLEAIIREQRLGHDAISLFNFIKGAIEGREYAKFVFTKSLSEVLSLIKQLGSEYNIGDDDLSYLNIQSLKNAYAGSEDSGLVMSRSISNGKDKYRVTKSLNLPPLIQQDHDVELFELPKNEPNFITLKSRSGKVVSEKVSRENLAGNILMIPSADPGYDWVFSHGIAGFITMYGGVNSHMAIRAGELGIPAVIGAGEALYKRWQGARRLEINCAQRQVHILQ